MTATSLRMYQVEWVGERPLTINRVANLNRFAWAQHTRETRRVWKNLARQAGIPRLARAEIIVTPLHKNLKTPQDPAAAAPEAKAAIDGLVDAGVIPDDSAVYVESVKFLGPDVCGVDGLRIQIVELPA